MGKEEGGEKRKKGGSQEAKGELSPQTIFDHCISARPIKKRTQKVGVGGRSRGGGENRGAKTTLRG